MVGVAGVAGMVGVAGVAGVAVPCLQPEAARRLVVVVAWLGAA